MKNTTPAVLLYPQDFIAGCAEMTMAERGAYITLLCYQNIHGHMSKVYIDRVCPDCPDYVLEKFDKDDDGKYYNARMEKEIERRCNYSKSRGQNRRKGVSGSYENHMNGVSTTYESHMETETETETEIRNKRVKGKDLEAMKAKTFSEI